MFLLHEAERPVTSSPDAVFNRPFRFVPSPADTHRISRLRQRLVHGFPIFGHTPAFLLFEFRKQPRRVLSGHSQKHVRNPGPHAFGFQVRPGHGIPPAAVGYGEQQGPCACA